MAEGWVRMCVLILFKQQAKDCSGFWREDDLWRHCQAAVASGTTWEVAYGHIVTTAICLLNLKWLPHTISCSVLCFKKGSIFTAMAFTDSTLQGQAVRVLPACFIWALLLSFSSQDGSVLCNTANPTALWTFLGFPVQGLRTLKFLLRMEEGRQHMKKSWCPGKSGAPLLMLICVTREATFLVKGLLTGCWPFKSMGKHPASMRNKELRCLCWAAFAAFKMQTFSLRISADPSLLLPEWLIPTEPYSSRRTGALKPPPRWRPNSRALDSAAVPAQ